MTHLSMKPLVRFALVAVLATIMLTGLLTITFDRSSWRVALAALPRVLIANAVPQMMNYQGTLKDVGGNLLSGQHTLTFKIYDSVVATTPLWEENHTGVTLRNGQFSVLLGYTTALPATVFNQPDRFLGIAVDGGAELSPRQQFAAVPYAFVAQEAYHAEEATHAQSADTANTATTAVTAANATNATNAERAQGLSASDGFPADAVTVDTEGSVTVQGGLTTVGKITTAQTEAGDPSSTVVTKGWLEAQPSTWPSGSYCILRAGGSCPAEFAPGDVCLDTEDDNNRDYWNVPIGDIQSEQCGGSSIKFMLCCK